MRDRQRGITLISLIIIVAFVASYAFAVLKVTPFYLEQIKVSRILKNTEEKFAGSRPTIAQIRDSIDKSLDIEMIRDLNTREHLKIKKAGSGYAVHAKYERRASYFGNIYLVVAFDETVEIKR